MYILRRRFILQRDQPFDTKAALSEIRRLRRWGTADLMWALNVSRSTLASWEVRGSIPNKHDGDAVEKLLEISRNCVTNKEPETA